MALFRGGDKRSAVHPVLAFWSWWNDDGHTIDPSRMSASTDTLTGLVQRIHPDLTWHFGAGTTAQHRLTVSAGGVAAVRPSAERWLRAAPAANRLWEFRSSQEPEPNALTDTLEIGGSRLDLADTRFRVDAREDGLRVDVGVHHPAFAAVAEGVRVQVTYLVLDWLLGEDDVERWVGQVEHLVDAPPAPATGAELRATVARIAAVRDPETWVLARGTTERGGTLLASWRQGVRWLDAPLFDRHQIVTAAYEPRPDGLPADSSVMDGFRELEDELTRTIGSRGLIVAVTTGDGARTLHAYTDGEDQNVDDALTGWARGRGVHLRAEPDPAWSAVRMFTG